MSRRIQDGVFRTNITVRHSRGTRMRAFYFSSLVIAFVALIILLTSIINNAVGLVVVDFATDPETLSDEPLDSLNAEQLAEILLNERPGLLLSTIHSELSPLSEITEMQNTALVDSLNEGVTIPEGLSDESIENLSAEQRAEILALNLEPGALLDVIEEEIIQETVLEAWSLFDSLLDRGEINWVFIDDEEYIERELNAEENLKWRSWLSTDFITEAISPTSPDETGVRPALLGSIWIISIVMLVSFPLGVGAAMYLEEYANDSWYNRLIETNIRNLAGVPSIIYGMLGLAIFVRALEALTSGNAFGTETSNGKTILSAGLTLSLLILPIIIISTQEALKAVPFSIREGSYGLGATKWQTISRQVLPAAIPGILTGTIIALSRAVGETAPLIVVGGAVGETAPLIVVGAATFISTDPSGPFSNFTALPTLIYRWTTLPNPQYQNAASAAIIILLVLLLTMNATAVFIRNRTSGKV